MTERGVTVAGRGFCKNASNRRARPRSLVFRWCSSTWTDGPGMHLFKLVDHDAGEELGIEASDDEVRAWIKELQLRMEPRS